jgi:hypothetical protein
MNPLILGLQAGTVGAEIVDYRRRRKAGGRNEVGISAFDASTERG